MFACLYSLSVPTAALVKIAEDFTPRFEVIGPLVMLDVSGLSRLFGSPQEIGEHLRRSSEGPVRIAIAPTQTAAALLAIGRAGLTVVITPEEQSARLSVLPVTLLGEFDRLTTQREVVPARPAATKATAVTGSLAPPHVAEMEDLRPDCQSSLDRTTELAAVSHGCGGGWAHPRTSHAANLTRRAGRPLTADLLTTVRRWGIKTFAELGALPPGDVYERLGGRGVLWQRIARGEDTTPLVPWVPEDPFESALDLEWPIEGLEPLSFVLGRLLEPLAERLERADRGAAILHTHLRLVSKDVHARTLQLPAPMRDAKTLRTLILLDLESAPPSAAIDRVRVLLEPTPARVTQWMLFERAQPSPEQVSTLVARLRALMGESHVGSPRLVDSWKPGVFDMTPFDLSGPLPSAAPAAPPEPAIGSALRRYRLPVPARVQVQDGRPVRVMTDRRGVTGGFVLQAAGPWRTSGEWWNAQPSFADMPASHGTTRPSCWDRDEWDVAMADGTVYRLYVEREVGQWFLEGVVD